MARHCDAFFDGGPIKVNRFVCLAGALAVMTSRAQAYIDTAPTLGRLLNDSTNVVVLQVEKVSKERRVIVYRKVADLKGVSAGEQVKHKITDGLHPSEPRLVLDWAEPGKLAIFFYTGRVGVTCVGPSWYECAVQDDEWWSMTRGRSELALAYFGSAERLREHATAILAGREVIITALRHENRNLEARPA